MGYLPKNLLSASSRSGRWYLVVGGEYSLMRGFLWIPETISQLTTFGQWKNVGSMYHPYGLSVVTSPAPPAPLCPWRGSLPITQRHTLGGSSNNVYSIVWNQSPGKEESRGWGRRWWDVSRVCWEKQVPSSIWIRAEERYGLFSLCIHVLNRRFTTRRTGLFMDSPKKKVKIWLLMVILLMMENAFSKIHLCLFCIDYVLLMRYQQICLRISRGKRDTLTLSWRRTLSYLMIRRIIVSILL